jgi:polysaccharide pyruvyl transferase WcaK-like protein
MCTNHFGSDDRWFYRRVFRGHDKLKQSLDNSLLGKELSPIDYCQSFVNADALLGMRFHSLVFGIGLGTNSIALDYTLGKGKVRSLAERFDTPLVSMIGLKKEELVEKLRTAIKSPKPTTVGFESLKFTEALHNALE